MTSFPALSPATRTFTPASPQHSTLQAIGGQQSRVGHSSAMVDGALRLSFVMLSEADMLSILTHYQGQQGDYLAFSIPSEVLSGFTAGDFTQAGYQWRYAKPPEIADFCGPLHDVSVELKTSVAENVMAAGFYLAAVANFYSATTIAPGAGLAAAASFAPGAASV